MWLAVGRSNRNPQLHEKIQTIFEQAIDARSPKNRPPGKAGLRAEKGYYRLLYLEEIFYKQTLSGLSATRAFFSWDQMASILRQLQDIPELQEEIRAGIETALRELPDPPS
jgi:hypothetical protein